ncbi:hypothetical protein U9M48_032533 [Paspalum notatum var. saurae]|uniref:Uncharacterized protein n=1 Tax=Paspalum notatum var. saurae TaxID=547442 RepID=A0AAQ3X4X6_PASNO
MEMPPVRAKGFWNIEEEYYNTLRTQSNACFLSEKHQSEEEMEAVLLDTREDNLISPMMFQNMITQMHPRRSSEMEFVAMVGYFDASAEASEMCRQLLKHIKSTQSNYRSMDSFLARMADGTASTASAREPAPAVRSNPFCTMTRSNFRQVHDRYSCMLRSIVPGHRRVPRKLKMAKAIKKLRRACLAMVGGAAAHLLFGPAAAAAGIYPVALMSLRRRAGAATTGSAAWKKRSSSSRTVSSLDAAAKSTYVLGRYLDTVSHLVARLSDGIERENDMARRCVEIRCPVQGVVSELRRSCSSSRRLAEELEEHVWLCLATIHKARFLVIQEISNQSCK